MPVIIIEGPEADKETKKEIIEKTSKIVSEAYHLPLEAITVTIHENPADNVGSRGHQLELEK